MSNILISIAFGFFAGLIFVIILYALSAIFDRLIDEIWPSSTEEMMHREAEKLQRKADKELKRRNRPNVFRFWNF